MTVDEKLKEMFPHVGKPIPVVRTGKEVRILKTGYAWNPLLTLPRNMKCPCDSGKKFKQCHLVNMQDVIPEKLAMEYKQGMRNVHLIKFTEDKDGKENPQSQL